MKRLPTPRHLIFALLPLLAAPIRPAAAKDDGTTALVTAANVYTAPLLTKMNFENVARVADEFTALAGSINEIMRRPDGAPVRYDHIRRVGDFHTQGAQTLLLRLIRAEFKRVHRPKVGLDPRLMREAIDTLKAFGSFGRSHPTDQSREFDDLIDEASKQLVDHIYGSTLDVELNLAREAMGARLINLPDLQNLLNRLEESGAKGERGNLARVEQNLRRHIVGQEHVVEGLMSQLWSNRLDAEERKPNVAYLTGPPGFGHRTIARGLARALKRFPSPILDNLLEIKPMKDHDDLWSAMGSATGYYGSEDGVPELLAWLVRFSGGKYSIELQRTDRGGEKYRVLKDPSWRPGEVKEHYESPDRAVLYVGNVQSWSKGLKDQWLLPAMKDGNFKINNPNGGETSITVPINVVIGGTEGTGLIAAKEMNGQRHGEPLPYARMKQKFSTAYQNVELLRSTLLQTNGSPNNPSSAKGPGVSEDFIKAIPATGLYLLAPYDPAELRRIAEMHLEEFARRLRGGNTFLGPTTLLWTTAVADLVATYGTFAEDGALGIDARLRALVKDPLTSLLKDGQLDGLGDRAHAEIALDVRENADRTRTLIARVAADAGAPVTVETVIARTLRDRPRERLSPERIAELATLGERLNKKVFGITPIVDRLSDRALSIANAATSDEPQPATVIAMDGWTSTGKTQTAIEYAEELLPEGEKLVTFDFSRIQTLNDFKEELMGLRDDRGNPIPSRFMKEYDRANGRLVVALDELANVRDERQLKVLYDLLRVPTMYTFSDNQPRNMTEVVFLITGNATQGIYSNVPTSLPRDIQMHAWEGIYQGIAHDHDAQRNELGKTYPEALMTRVQTGNLFLMPPHTWRTLRQLAQLKVGLALKKINTTASRHGWEIVFADLAEYARFIDVIVEEGFKLKDQGASIDKYVADDFTSRVETLLLRQGVESGSRVVVKFESQTPNDDEARPGVVNFDLYVDGRPAPLRFTMPRRREPRGLGVDPNVFLKTSFHEAGHELVQLIALAGAYEPRKLSVINGVTKIANDWVVYAGIASSTQVMDVSLTRDAVVRHIAVDLAGETAERLVTRGAAHAAGKANDIENTATLAQNAILRFGLSERWGLDAVPRGENIETYKTNLPERDKLLLRDEARRLIRDGRRMAERILEANFDRSFVPLGLKMAETGEMAKAEILKFHAEHPSVDPARLSVAGRCRARAMARVRAWRNPARPTLSPEIIAEVPRPRAFANIKEIVNERRRKLYATVPPPDHPPIGRNATFDARQPLKLLAAPRAADCEGALVSAR